MYDKKKIARIPQIPIDYENRNNSVKGEIMVDWEDRTIYGKNPYTNEINRLASKDENEHKSQLDVSYFGGIRPLPHRYAYDERSIICYNRIIQLKDFDKADINSIPYKGGDGYLLWDNKYELTKSSMIRNKIIGVKVNNDMIILKDGNFYELTNLTGNINIRLPFALSNSYAKIIMKLTTNDNISYNISGNLIWEYKDDSIFKPNTMRIYIFETWDNGTNWFVSTKIYDYDNNLNIDYFKNNYFNKTEINNLISWSYVDKPNDKFVYKIKCVKTISEYKSINNIDNNTFYFIEDSSQIFRGNHSFSFNYKIVDEFPINDIIDNITYIHKSNLQKKIYNGDKWIEISKPLINIIDDTIILDNYDIPNKLAIINYIKSKYVSKIEDLTEDDKIISSKILKLYIDSLLEIELPTNNNSISSIITPKSLVLYMQSIILDNLDDTNFNKVINYNMLKEFISSITISDILISDIEFDKIKNNLITAKATKEYINSLIPSDGFIDSINYTEDGDLFIKGTDESKSKTIVLKNQLINAELDKINNKIIFTNGSKNKIDILLPKILTIKNTICDNINNILTIIYDDNSTIDIDLSPLFQSINPTKFISTDTTSVSLDGENRTKIDVKISNKENNMLKKISVQEAENGLFIEKQMPLLQNSINNRVVLSQQNGETKCSIYSISDQKDADADTTLLVAKTIREIINDCTKLSSKSTNILKWSNEENEEGYLVEIDFSAIESTISISTKNNNILKKISDQDTENGLYATLTDKDIETFKLAKILEAPIGSRLLLSNKENGNYIESDLYINKDVSKYGSEVTISPDNITKEYINNNIALVTNYQENITKSNINDFNNTIVSFDSYINNVIINGNIKFNIYTNEIINKPNNINITVNNTIINGTWKCKSFIGGRLTDKIFGTDTGDRLTKYIFIGEFPAPANYSFNPIICDKINSFISNDGKTYILKIKVICIDR